MTTEFQPTLPARGATRSRRKSTSRPRFQPTLPARGATPRGGRTRRRKGISTHAPRTGSDTKSAHVDAFQGNISTHAPRTGSDPPRQRQQAAGRLISTHAPRTGSDPPPQRAEIILGDISTHAPRTGSDIAAEATTVRPYYFNPRSPHGERRTFSCAAGCAASISTHAPRTGSDLRFVQHRVCSLLFQPTLPARGATETLLQRGWFTEISTHAPRTGSDLFVPLTTFHMAHFNPRSPHGERQRKVTILSIRIIGFAQKVYHKTVLLRISLAENAVILPKRPQNPVRTSLQKAGGLRFARAIRAARPYSISSPSGA